MCHSDNASIHSTEDVKSSGPVVEPKYEEINKSRALSVSNPISPHHNRRKNSHPVPPPIFSSVNPDYVNMRSESQRRLSLNLEQYGSPFLQKQCGISPGGDENNNRRPTNEYATGIYHILEPEQKPKMANINFNDVKVELPADSFNIEYNDQGIVITTSKVKCTLTKITSSISGRIAHV